MLARTGISLVIACRRSPARSVAHLLRRLALESDGQDLVEYALLTTFIGCAGAAAWSAMQTSLGAAYSGFNTAVWNAWQPSDPAGSGS